MFDVISHCIPKVLPGKVFIIATNNPYKNKLSIKKFIPLDCLAMTKRENTKFSLLYDTLII